LTQTIFVLRRTLGESPDGKPFIDTVPRRGYRFTADVRAEIETPPAGVDQPGVWRRRRSWIAAALVTVTALIWFGTSWARRGGDTSPRIRSLVVLPFGNLSGDTGQDYLAESLNDALITSLGQISSLRVISRTSAMTYKDTGKTVPQIARELNVDAVVEGTVQRSAGRVRVNLKLIQASTDRTLWAESYERDLQQAQELHNEIARTIASRTGVTLTPRESARLAETTRVNPQVSEAYLKGRYFWNRRSEPDMRQAIEHFEEALRLDADTLRLRRAGGFVRTVWIARLDPGRRPPDQALAAAEKALGSTNFSPTAHSRARIALNYESIGREPERDTGALELNPAMRTRITGTGTTCC
jgi:TolB-like protein